MYQGVFDPCCVARVLMEGFYFYRKNIEKVHTIS